MPMDDYDAAAGSSSRLRAARLRCDGTELRFDCYHKNVGFSPYLGADSGVAFFSGGGRSPGSRSSSSQCSGRPSGGAVEQPSVRPCRTATCLLPAAIRHAWIYIATYLSLCNPSPSQSPSLKKNN